MAVSGWQADRDKSKLTSSDCQRAMTGSELHTFFRLDLGRGIKKNRPGRVAYSARFARHSAGDYIK